MHALAYLLNRIIAHYWVLRLSKCVSLELNIITRSEVLWVQICLWIVQSQAFAEFWDSSQHLVPLLGHGDFLFSAIFHFEINHLTHTYPTDTPVYFELVKIVPTTCWCPHLPAPIPLPFRISTYSQGQPQAQNSLAITLSYLFAILKQCFCSYFSVIWNQK